MNMYVMKTRGKHQDEYTLHLECMAGSCSLSTLEADLQLYIIIIINVEQTLQLYRYLKSKAV